MLRRNRHTRIDDQRKEHSDQKRPPKRNRPQQLKTFRVPSDDVENFNGTNQGGNFYSLISHGLFPEESKGCRMGKRGTDQQYIDQHISKESKTRRKM